MNKTFQPTHRKTMNIENEIDALSRASGLLQSTTDLLSDSTPEAYSRTFEQREMIFKANACIYEALGDIESVMAKLHEKQYRQINTANAITFLMLLVKTPHDVPSECLDELRKMFDEIGDADCDMDRYFIAITTIYEKYEKAIFRR
jgi:hypothetical protein